MDGLLKTKIIQFQEDNKVVIEALITIMCALGCFVSILYWGVRQPLHLAGFIALCFYALILIIGAMSAMFSIGKNNRLMEIRSLSMYCILLMVIGYSFLPILESESIFILQNSFGKQRIEKKILNVFNTTLICSVPKKFSFPVHILRERSFIELEKLSIQVEITESASVEFLEKKQERIQEEVLLWILEEIENGTNSSPLLINKNGDSAPLHPEYKIEVQKDISAERITSLLKNNSKKLPTVLQGQIRVSL